MNDASQLQPRVFISYSWSSEEHCEWVANLGRRLMSDGIDVVLDQWSLEHGQDVYAFMEKMVNDPTIKRVIIISDSMYAAKADDRKGGVGTETQIISKEVYDSVDQNKFIPVVRERDVERNACLPVFLKTRKYLDFSDSDAEADAYDQLIRNIFERPRRQKPALGKPPSHLFEDSPVSVTSAQKAKRFREVIGSGKGKPSVAFEDFAVDFILNLEELRMTYSREIQDKWCGMIRENIARAHVHRDVFVDVISTGAMHMEGPEFVQHLSSILESVLAFSGRPNESRVYFEISEDNYKFLCYEFFVYSIAALVKARRFNDARQLIEHRYVVPSTCGGHELVGRDFCRFSTYASSLEEACAQEGGRRRLSVMADLLHDRADRTDIRFSDLFQADVILALASRGRGWYPRSMIYCRDVGKLELFLRAVTHEGVRPLETLINVESPQELLALLRSEEMRRLWQSEKFFHADVSLESLNLDELTRVWQGK